MTPANAKLQWSRDIGIVSIDSNAILVYKRRIGGVEHLWFDVLTFDSSTELFIPRAEPIPFPQQEFEVCRFGFPLWVEEYNGRLHMVVQTFDCPSQTDPKLVLFRTTVPLADFATLGLQASWERLVLDEGGWDFGARREGRSLAIVHRRTPAAYRTAVQIEGFEPPIQILPLSLTENSNLAPQVISEMVTENLVLVQVDLDSFQVTSTDTSFPSGQNPHIHRIDPFVATVDRLENGQVNFFGDIECNSFRSATFLCMSGSRGGWLSGRLFGDAIDFPVCLNAFARLQQAVKLGAPSAGPQRLSFEWAQLWTLRPVTLFGIEQADKGILLTFAHNDPGFTALRSSRFLVSPDDNDGTLNIFLDGYSILDIGHQPIRSFRAKTEEEDVEPEEYAQFHPFLIDSSGNQSDVEVHRIERSANSLTATLRGHRNRPHSFYAYTDAGDGGVRVFFNTRLQLNPPTASREDKAFSIDMVPENDEPGRAWVRLRTDAPVDTDLPGYFAPESHPNPYSRVSTVQAMLDGLAFLNDINHGADTELLSLTKADADALQDYLPSVVPNPPPVRSASDQPFRIQMEQLQPTIFAAVPMRFRASAVGVEQDGFVFSWTTSQGETSDEPLATFTFSRTLPNFSAAHPGKKKDDVNIVLTVTAPDGRISKITRTFPVPRSLWSTLWDAYGSFRREPDDHIDLDEEQPIAPGFFVRNVTVGFWRYKMSFHVNDEGKGTKLDIRYGKKHNSRYLFTGRGDGQGDIVYEVPVQITIPKPDGSNPPNIRLTGTFGGGLGRIVQIDSIDATIAFVRNYTVGVQTSERRTNRTDSETILHGNDMIASALVCTPTSASGASLTYLDVQSSLTGEARTIGVLVGALLAAGLGVLLLLLLLPILIFVVPAAAVAAIVAGGLGAVLNAVVGALGAAAVVAMIEAWIVKPKVTETIRQGLEDPSVARGLERSGLQNYAGEGLAEAIARHVMQQASMDGLDVDQPGDIGSDRFRAPFFETIAVEAKRCKVKIQL